MSYTTKERHDIYKKAYAGMISDDQDYWFTCHAISKAATGRLSALDSYQVWELFPEFQLFLKDPSKTFSFTKTLNINDERNGRQTVLAFCIAMTENETSC